MRGPEWWTEALPRLCAQVVHPESRPAGGLKTNPETADHRKVPLRGQVSSGQPGHQTHPPAPSCALSTLPASPDTSVS